MSFYALDLCCMPRASVASEKDTDLVDFLIVIAHNCLKHSRVLISTVRLIRLLVTGCMTINFVIFSEIPTYVWNC